MFKLFNRWRKQPNTEELLVQKFAEIANEKANPERSYKMEAAGLRKENETLKQDLKMLQEQNVALMKINENLRHEQILEEIMLQEKD